MTKCLGMPNEDGGFTDCLNPVPEGEDWCDECGDKMMQRLAGCWADIAQKEVPQASKETLLAKAKRILKIG